MAAIGPALVTQLVAMTLMGTATGSSSPPVTGTMKNVFTRRESTARRLLRCGGPPLEPSGGEQTIPIIVAAGFIVITSFLNGLLSRSARTHHAAWLAFDRPYDSVRLRAVTKRLCRYVAACANTCLDSEPGRCKIYSWQVAIARNSLYRPSRQGSRLSAAELTRRSPVRRSRYAVFTCDLFH